VTSTSRLRFDELAVETHRQHVLARTVFTWLTDARLSQAVALEVRAVAARARDQVLAAWRALAGHAVRLAAVAESAFEPLRCAGSDLESLGRAGVFAADRDRD